MGEVEIPPCQCVHQSTPPANVSERVLTGGAEHKVWIAPVNCFSEALYVLQYGAPLAFGFECPTASLQLLLLAFSRVSKLAQLRNGWEKPAVADCVLACVVQC